jgi:hypothetical protein
LRSGSNIWGQRAVLKQGRGPIHQTFVKGAFYQVRTHNCEHAETLLARLFARKAPKYLKPFFALAEYADLSRTAGTYAGWFGDE